MNLYKNDNQIGGRHATTTIENLYEYVLLN